MEGKYLYQSPKEELVNSISHGIGGILSVIGLVVLIFTSTKTGDDVKVLSFAVYGSSLVFVYLSSTLSHAIVRPKIKRVFQILDYVSIYFLIAASYTPILLGPLKEEVDFNFFLLIWALALSGIYFKIFYFGRYEVISMLIYLAMGWIAVVLLGAFIKVMSINFIVLIFIGGLMYTIGTIFYMTGNKKYHHFIWHIFVLAGSISHYIAIVLN